MKRGLAVLPLLVVAALGAGCSRTTEHSLASPPAMHGPTPRECSVGVGRLVDDFGVDFAFDLRDYLRAHGPCREVRLVGDPVSDQTDFVVSGRLGGGRGMGRTPEQNTGVLTILIGGVAGTCVSAPLLIVGKLATPYGGETAAQRQSDQQTFDTLATVGLVGLAVTAAVIATGAVLLVDNGGAKEMASAPLEADIEITHAGDTVARFALRDMVAARGTPLQRTPTHARGDEFAPLQRPLVERVFEHIAAKLDEVSLATPRPPAGVAEGP